jgi:small conductance mechanosensitive channel
MISYSLILVGIIFILSAWGVDSSTLLVSFGVIGFAVTFGAQSIIEDLLSGILIIIDKQYQVGDIIYIDGFRGKVLEIHLRTTRFLDVANLDIKYINNEDVRNIINASQRNSVAVCEVGIEYGEDLTRVEKVLENFLPDLFDKYKEILETPKYLGVSSLGDSAVVLKITAVTHEDNKLSIQSILNREIKLLFDAHKIGIPFPQVTISHLNENNYNF